MRRYFSLVVIGLVSGLVSAQDPSATGAQPGQVLPGPFRAYVVTAGQAPKSAADGVLSEERQNLGDVARVGKIHDFVTRYGLDPTVAVFAREIPQADQPLGKFLKAIDQAVEKHRDARLRGFAIFLGLKAPFLQDDSQPAQIKAIEGLAQQLQLKAILLGLDQAESERTKAYLIPPEATAVVLISVNQTVQARHNFSVDKPLDDSAIQAILGEIGKLVSARR